MNNMIYIIGGILIIITGVLLLTRKKFMIGRIYTQLFSIIFLLLKPSMEIIITYHNPLPLFIFILLFIFNIKINIHKFTLTNMDAQMVVSILTGILKEKNISYERHEKKIILKDYENKEITYTQMLNTVDIDFSNIKDSSFLKEIEEEVRYRIKKIESKVFPSSGIFNIVLGTIFIILVHNYSI